MIRTDRGPRRSQRRFGLRPAAKARAMEAGSISRVEAASLTARNAPQLAIKAKRRDALPGVGSYCSSPAGRPIPVQAEAYS